MICVGVTMPLFVNISRSCEGKMRGRATKGGQLVDSLAFHVAHGGVIRLTVLGVTRKTYMVVIREAGGFGLYMYGLSIVSVVYIVIVVQGLLMGEGSDHYL